MPTALLGSVKCVWLECESMWARTLGLQAWHKETTSEACAEADQSAMYSRIAYSKEVRKADTNTNARADVPLGVGHPSEGTPKKNALTIVKIWSCIIATIPV